ncbi:Astrotactin-2, partial [Ophiophagus hannah]
LKKQLVPSNFTHDKEEQEAVVFLHLLQENSCCVGKDVTRKGFFGGHGSTDSFSFSVGGVGFGHTKGNSGSEADDETQLTCYTEQYRSRRRSKGSLKSPVNKTALTLVAVSSCILAMVCGTQISCPLTVKVTLHVPEHFIADGSSFVVSEGSYLDISDWLNPAKLSLYYQINATSPWIRDLCGQRTTDACEHLCDEETGECSCHEGYAPDPVHRHLCIRNTWEHSEGPWPYTTLERGYDLVTGEQAPEKILRAVPNKANQSGLVNLAGLNGPFLSSREEAMLSTYFETINDLLSSFGPVRDCSHNNGGCTRNFKCVSDRQVDSTGCVCPEDLRPMKDGTGCYDYSKGIDCSDGFNGGYKSWVRDSCENDSWHNEFSSRENNFIKDFPQLADALAVIPLPVEEQCRGVLSEPLPNLQLLTGFANVLKILNKDSSREELLYFIQQYGSHYIAEGLYGSEFSCTIHFPSKKIQQQLWLQYQKESILPFLPFLPFLPSNRSKLRKVTEVE